MTTSNEHNNAHAQEQCNACCGTGRMVRDPDIGTDQECFVCDGTGFLPAQYNDSTPQLSVGESSFESWFESYNPANKGDKQRSRDAYAAGMGDPLVTVTPAQEVVLTNHQFDLICQAIDKADTVTMEGDYMLDSDDCINVVRVMQALFDIAALRAKEKK